MISLSLIADVCTNQGHEAACGLPTAHANSANLQNILQIVFGVMAAVAVLFIVLAGFRMVTAQGDAQQVSKARSTIVYAVIGLLIALLAEAMVAFVLDKLA